MTTLGERTKKQLYKKGLTQSAAAQKLDVAPNTFTRWVNGNRTPDISTIKKIADVLGTTVGYLIGETDDDSLSPAQDVGLPSKSIDIAPMRLSEIQRLHLSKNLKRFREEANLTQEGLANMTFGSITKDLINEVENNERAFTFPQLKVLASVFGFAPEVFLYHEDQIARIGKPHIIHFTNGDPTAQDILAKLSDARRQISLIRDKISDADKQLILGTLEACRQDMLEKKEPQ